MTHQTTILTIAIAAGAASAGSLFTWSGTATGTAGGVGLADADFTLSIFVEDVSSDLTPGAGIGSYEIGSIRMAVNGGAFSETFGSFDAAWSSVFIDPGTTQLAGASNLFGGVGGDASFQVGALLPGGAFTDPSDLAGTGSFALTGLSGTGFNFFESGRFDLSLSTTSFAYSTNITAIPLPTPVAMAGAAFAAVGGVARRKR